MLRSSLVLLALVAAHGLPTRHRQSARAAESAERRIANARALDAEVDALSHDLEIEEHASARKHEARLHHPVHEYTQRAAGVVAHAPPAEPHALVAGTGDLSGDIDNDVRDLTPLLADVEVDAEREWKPKKPEEIQGLVDVRICSAIPLLEEQVGHCEPKYTGCSGDACYERCVRRALETVEGNEGVLLKNLYGVWLIADKAGVKNMDDEEVYTAFKFMAWDAKNQKDIKTIFNMNGKNDDQKGRFLVNTLKCVLQVVPYAKDAIKEESLERDADDVGGYQRAARSHALELKLPELPKTLAEFERKRKMDRNPAEQTGCAFVISSLAQAVMGALKWNNVDSWRVKADVELIDTYLEELMLILARMDTLRVTDLALKELLCTVSLFQTYWDFRRPDVSKEFERLQTDAHNIDKNHEGFFPRTTTQFGGTDPVADNGKPVVGPAPGHLIKPWTSSDNLYLPSLGLTRVVESRTKSQSTEYFVWDAAGTKRGSDMSKMVDDMLEQLGRVKENMRQALQAQIVEATVPKHGDVAPEMRCPITKELFVDPVLTTAGDTYERKNIEEWFAKHEVTSEKSALRFEVTDTEEEDDKWVVNTYKFDLPKFKKQVAARVKAGLLDAYKEDVGKLEDRIVVSEMTGSGMEKTVSVIFTFNGEDEAKQKTVRENLGHKFEMSSGDMHFGEIKPIVDSTVKWTDPQGNVLESKALIPNNAMKKAVEQVRASKAATAGEEHYQKLKEAYDKSREEERKAREEKAAGVARDIERDQVLQARDSPASTSTLHLHLHPPPSRARPPPPPLPEGTAARDRLPHPPPRRTRKRRRGTRTGTRRVRIGHRNRRGERD